MYLTAAGTLDDFFTGCFTPFLAAANHYHRRPTLRQANGRCLANSCICSGDNTNFSVHTQRNHL
jgi:hypothetical protein